MTRGTVALFGNFGTGNLGNECTVQAVIQRIRRDLPDVRIACICSNPGEVAARYDVPAIPLYGRPRCRSPRPSHALVRLLRRLFVRLPQELWHWGTAVRALKGTRMLVMTGTGMLGDFGITPGDLHYEILKWSLAARLRRCEIVFLSVGAGHLDHPLSRWLVRRAVALADYRSFRDRLSRDYLASIGAHTQDDPVYPDLAFSFPERALAGLPNGSASGRVVAVGLMDYYGKESRPETGERRYRAYLEAMATFTAWLLRRQYTVRLLIGDLSYDTRAKRDLIAALRRGGVVTDARHLLDEPLRSVDELLAQLATTDLVVATRYHNVLLALLLHKPVVSISYDRKNDALMAQAGLADYCQPIDRLDVRALIQQFVRLEGDRAAIAMDLRQRAEQHRQRLDEQYAAIFRTPATPDPTPRVAASAIHPAGVRC